MTPASAQTGITASRPICHYALGNTDAEHERLIRQAARLAPLTERLFREAGIGAGQRVLDLGSGVGDVAMLASRLAGSSGEVVGVEHDARSIARARTRVAEADLRNVRFLHSDVDQIASDKPFDAVVGRFILMYVPDPVISENSISLKRRKNWQAGFEGARQRYEVIPLDVTWCYAPGQGHWRGGIATLTVRGRSVG